MGRAAGFCRQEEWYRRGLRLCLFAETEAFLFGKGGYTVNCPKCGKEMEPGYLYYRSGPLIWTKNRKKVTFVTTSKDVLVCEGGIVTPWPEACICKDCCKVVVDY